jgi:hypothetical protein
MALPFKPTRRDAGCDGEGGVLEGGGSGPAEVADQRPVPERRFVLVPSGRDGREREREKQRNRDGRQRRQRSEFRVENDKRRAEACMSADGFTFLYFLERMKKKCRIERSPKTTLCS